MLILFLGECFGQHASQEPVTVSGCVMNMNGRFRILAHGETYILKGHHSELFGYNGKLVEVTGTVESHTKTPSPGIPLVLHITSVRKLADTCN
jgi:hypothetical protein